MGFLKFEVPFWGGSHNKDYSISGSILGSPCFGKLPNTVVGLGFRVQGLTRDPGIKGQGPIFLALGVRKPSGCQNSLPLILNPPPPNIKYSHSVVYYNTLGVFHKGGVKGGGLVEY